MYDDAITFGQRQIKKNYRSVTGHFPSVKNNRSIGFESSLEKILFLYLEFDNTVETYQEQPRIMIIKNGKPQKYDVDCFVKRYKKSNLKDALIEVKYLSKFEKNKDIDLYNYFSPRPYYKQSIFHSITSHLNFILTCE